MIMSIYMLVRHYRQRLAITGLGSIMLISAHASAQDPVLVPAAPQWSASGATGSMVLTPASSNLALGLSEPRARLHVMGKDVTADPATGYLVLGTTNMLHMQLDRNDIRVAGPTDSTVGSLYLQRFGGPITVHGSKPLESRMYITNDGNLGVATADPFQFAIDRNLIAAHWQRPPGAIAVDGDVYADKVISDYVYVTKRLRLGGRKNSSPGVAWDAKHSDAILQVGGKMSAQSIVVHLDKWSDDVFDDEYPLLPLSELEAFIKRERHLPDVPAESEVLSTGLDLAKSDEILLRKVEELTLHTIAQQKKIDELERKIDALVK